MARFFANVGQLGMKELRSLRYDPLLLFLIAYAFTFSVYSAAHDAAIDVRNAAVAVVDEDRSPLSRSIREAILPPEFQRPDLLGWAEIDAAMEAGRYTFVLVLPQDLQRDLLSGERPAVKLAVDATAMSVAGRGSLYLQQILEAEVRRFLGRGDGSDPATSTPVRLVTRARFNPNLESAWFQGVIEVVGNITILAIILAGAAVIREREHGTLEHLLVMPLRPTEIMLAKVWSNGLVILVAALLSLLLVVRAGLGVPIALSSLPLFAVGAAVFLFAVTALGILLATAARSMPQFGLLSIPVFMVMLLLSGTYTPLDAIPQPLRAGMLLSPSTHFVAFSKTVLFREGGLAVAWPDLLGVTITGAAFFAVGLARFRVSVSAGRG